MRVRRFSPRACPRAITYSRYAPHLVHCMATAGVVIVMAAMKRGSSLCEGCGVSNGNRAVTCKGCSKLLTTKSKRPKSDPVAHHSSNVTLLLDEESATEIATAYSARIRPQGPDYRCFVTKGIDGAWKCTNKECEVVRQGRVRSGKRAYHGCGCMDVYLYMGC